VTVLVYYSGSVHSWFWSMYPLFILKPPSYCETPRCVVPCGLVRSLWLAGAVEFLDSPAFRCRFRPMTGHGQRGAW
jgi:hypothetical protein